MPQLSPSTFLQPCCFSLPSLACCGHSAAADKRLVEWDVIKLWFAGVRFDSIDALVHAWKKDLDGIKSGFHYVFPGELYLKVVGRGWTLGAHKTLLALLACFGRCQQ